MPGLSVPSPPSATWWRARCSRSGRAAAAAGPGSAAAWAASAAAPTCRGTGLRLRLGRRVWNYLRHQHAEGVR